MNFLSAENQESIESEALISGRRGQGSGWKKGSS